MRVEMSWELGQGKGKALAGSSTKERHNYWLVVGQNTKKSGELRGKRE
jgi:hypothetical protein